MIPIHHSGTSSQQNSNRKKAGGHTGLFSIMKVSPTGVLDTTI